MSELYKYVQVIDLFDEATPILNAGQVADRLQVSRPTAFRQLKALCEVGLLSNVSGRYALGPRIVELDYRMKRCDPVLEHSIDSLRKLAAMPGCAAALVSMFGDKIVYTHVEYGAAAVTVDYARGMSLPLFRGAASKILVSQLKSAVLRKFFDKHQADPDIQRVGTEWDKFQAYYREFRKQGYYVSHAELQPNANGVAAPIVYKESGATNNCIVLIVNNKADNLLEERILIELVCSHARAISSKMAALHDPADVDEDSQA